MAGIPQIKVIFDRRKKASAVNPGTVEIEVSYNRERVRLSTGVAVLKQQWNGREVVNHPEADRLNEQIRRVYDGLHEKMATIASKKGSMTSRFSKGEENKGAGLVGQLPRLAGGAHLHEAGDRINTPPTPRHAQMPSRVRPYPVLLRPHAEEHPTVGRFHTQARHGQSSVHGYHKRLKPYIIEAIQFEKLEANPYDGMRISRGKSEGIKFLTEEERDRVEALPELYGMTEKVRDMFIFSCYTGLAYSDLVKIKKSDVFMQGDDYCIRDKRLKTGMPYTIVLLPKAIAILRKYDYNLNLMSNQKCNDQLKLIASMANLHINLTMHVGRHTFATRALTKGVGIETVSKMLAHSNVTMTEKYAQVLQTSVIQGFNLLK